MIDLKLDYSYRVAGSDEVHNAETTYLGRPSGMSIDEAVKELTKCLLDTATEAGDIEIVSISISQLVDA